MLKTRTIELLGAEAGNLGEIGTTRQGGAVQHSIASLDQRPVRKVAAFSWGVVELVKIRVENTGVSARQDTKCRG